MSKYFTFIIILSTYLMYYTYICHMDTDIIHNFDAMSIANEIRRARRSLDITQSNLADMVTKHPLNEKEGIKITQKEISSLEKGNGNPTMKKLEGIVRVLGKEWKLIDVIKDS